MQFAIGQTDDKPGASVIELKSSDELGKLVEVDHLSSVDSPQSDAFVRAATCDTELSGDIEDGTWDDAFVD